MNPATGRFLLLSLVASIALAPACSPPPNDRLVVAIQTPAQSFSGFPVELVGSATGTGARGDLGYRWALVQRPSGSEAEIGDAAAERTSFTPDRPGRYTIRLVVSQGKAAGRTADVPIEAKPWFTEVAVAPRAPGPVPPVGTAWGDYNNDGHPDVYVSALKGRQALYAGSGDDTYVDATDVAIGSLERAVAGAWGDFDNDGHLDLAVATHGDAVDPGKHPDAFGDVTLYRNLGDGRFADVSSQARLGRDLPDSGRSAESDSWQCRRPGQPAWLDFDADGRLDLFVVCEGGAGRSVLFRNLGGETFEDATRKARLEASGGSGVAVGDYDNDGDPDLFVHGTGPARLWENNRDGTFSDVTSAARIEGIDSSGASAAFFDLDNDGDLDIYLGGVDGVLFLNVGNGVFSNATATAGAGIGTPAQRVGPEDIDDDGDQDLILVEASGKERFFRNDLAGYLNNRWLRVSLEGTSSNHFGIGARVEVTTTDGTSRTAWPTGTRTSRVRDPMALHFGLGRTEWASVRVTWPSGIAQDFWFLRPDQTFWAREAVLEGSCPLVFAWDGTKYSFVSDILGSAVTGFYLGDGQYRFPVDTDEYLALDGLRPKDGAYSIQIVEALNEIIYLDHARLLAIDHPAGTSVIPNERLALFPPFPDFGVHVVRDARPPVAAYDDRGNDLMPQISRKDGIFAEGFEFAPYQGLAEVHSQVLDLGDLSQARTVLLVMSGWTNYVTSYSLDAASRRGVHPMLPMLEALDPSGNWVVVAPDMGFPAGQPKTMVYDLTGKLPAGGRMVRITTNLQIFWDQVLISTHESDSTIHITELSVSAADVHRRGNPILSPAPSRRAVAPASYDYESIEATGGRWAIPQGNYTRYGDVAALLAEVDDKYVIMHVGDEVTARFDAAPLPGLADGWTRSFFLYLDGFLKYVDPYVADALTVGPLPFHQMSNYPYPPDEGFPADGVHQRYLAEYNTRREGPP